MSIDVQDAVCAFVRDIISARTAETINITARPDRDQHHIKAPEELWESPTRRYAIEHTRVEAFEGQTANLAKFLRLLLPAKQVLGPYLPGYFCLSLREAELSAARIDMKTAPLEIARLVLEAAPHVRVDEVVTLRSDKLPVELHLYLRHKNSSELILYTDIEGDSEAKRLERIRRALADKFPKLAEWTKNGGTSVLALESNDIQLSNATLINAAVQRALKERTDQPGIVVLVETEVSPMNAWMLKEGNSYGDDIPTLNGGYLYTEGDVRR